MKKNTISTHPYKGTRDLLPNDYLVEKYIFDTWREVCLRFGYKEYLTPLLEFSDIYNAKSGSVKEELFILYDRANRELALRPEMTPSVTRMVSSIYKGYPKPIRLFSIANFFRNEAPQKGRMREFWQLNADIFGNDDPNSDIEILCLALEIMLAFGASQESFKLYFNSRNLLEQLFSSLSLSGLQATAVARIMDKFDRTGTDETRSLLQNTGLQKNAIDAIMLFLNSSLQTMSASFPELSRQTGYIEVSNLKYNLDKLGYANCVDFKPHIIRGFDYYNGMVFEIFDQSPNNKRSLFGGGRYNGLSEIFGVTNFPAVGFAPGSSTTRLFLENWKLLPNFYSDNSFYCPLLVNDYLSILRIVNLIRKTGARIELDLSVKNLSDALRSANKLGFNYVLIIGDDELKNRTLTIKNLAGNTQETKSFEKYLLELS